MNYEESVNYINEIARSGSIYGLDTIKLFLSRLNNPQQTLKFVHIAGTNGKGSVSAYLTKILAVANYKVGTFNSPAVFSFNEQFLINGKPIDNELITSVIETIKSERDLMIKEGITQLPTGFELLFAMALLIFKSQHCDIVILETGLGGIMDATNVIDNKLCAVITSISLEHTQILGNTLEAIATQKFGIVKDILITYKQDPVVMKVFKKAKHLYLASTPKLQIANLSGITFLYKQHSYKLTMLGEYQIQNAALAIATIQYLGKCGFVVTKEELAKGLYLTQLPGRCEKLTYNNKIIILDGAHNPNGAKSLASALKLHFGGISKSFVFGVFKDKNVDEILHNMNGLSTTIHIASAPTERGLDISSMKNICEKYYNNVITEDSISKALEHALSDNTDMVVVFGSLSILKEAKCYILRQEDKNE